MENNTKGLMEFTKDVQSQPKLRAKAEELLKKMKEENMSHAIFCSFMLKLAIQEGYQVTAAGVAELRAQKDGYEFSEEVKAEKGRFWPFDYSYCIEKEL